MGTIIIKSNIKLVNSYRTNARIAGILFIIATVASIVGTAVTDPIIKSSEPLVKIAANQNQVIIGAILGFTAALSSASIALWLYPILKHYDETKAIAAVGFRIIEGVFYSVGAIILILLVYLSTHLIISNSVVNVLLVTRNITGFIFGATSFSMGGLLYYFIFYRSRLIPRWLSAWGILGVALLLAAIFITIFAKKNFTIEGSLMILALPIALQEMILAVWLIFKGFSAQK